MAVRIEEIINQAARQAGIKRRINNIYEGSALSLAALDVYGQTRDELLKRQSWNFAQRERALALSSLPPTMGWLYAYEYPVDALLIRAVLPFPIISPDLNPQDYLFTIFNLATGFPVMTTARAILSNVANAIAIFTGRVIDPQQWDVGFTAALIASLQEKLTPALAAVEANMAALAAGKTARALGVGIDVNELQPPIDVPSPAPLPAQARG